MLLFSWWMSGLEENGSWGKGEFNGRSGGQVQVVGGMTVASLGRAVMVVVAGLWVAWWWPVGCWVGERRMAVKERKGFLGNLDGGWGSFFILMTWNL